MVYLFFGCDWANNFTKVTLCFPYTSFNEQEFTFCKIIRDIWISEAINVTKNLKSGKKLELRLNANPVCLKLTELDSVRKFPKKGTYLKIMSK